MEQKEAHECWLTFPLFPSICKLTMSTADILAYKKCMNYEYAVFKLGDLLGEYDS
jgi:hypothetical protein